MDGDQPSGRFSLRESPSVSEVSLVLARFGLGEALEVGEPKRGSGGSAVVRTPAGRFLLKRHQSPSERRRLAHAAHDELARQGYPVAPVVRVPGSADGREAVIGARTYEVFRWVEASAYDGSIGATAEAGRVLEWFHRLLAAVRVPGAPEHHDAPVAALTLAAGTRLGASAAGVLRRLSLGHADAMRRVRELGWESWPRVVVHGDWHPGNVLYADGRVAAVVDLDSCRLGPRALDLANGALQFSMDLHGGAGRTPGLDGSRLAAFCRGYESAREAVISTAELEALPWLMIVALVVESLEAIAATGKLGGMEGEAALQMVDAQAAWMQRESGRLRAIVGGG